MQRTDCRIINSKSVLKAYQNEAYIAINKLSEEKEWNNCKDGTNEEKISAFITLYLILFMLDKLNTF